MFIHKQQSYYSIVQQNVANKRLCGPHGIQRHVGIENDEGEVPLFLKGTFWIVW